jgi:hypothetical protein
MKREDFFETLKPHRRLEYIDEELDMWIWIFLPLLIIL